MKKIGTFVPLFSLISHATGQVGVIENGIPFIDWLVKTRQSTWQVLPLHERQLIPGSSTERVMSPYKGYGIGLNPSYLSDESRKSIPTDAELDIFIDEEKNWIDDYSLFCALRDESGTDDWRKWNAKLRKREEQALQAAKVRLSEKVRTHTIEQWQLHNAYSQLKKYAKEKSVTLIGDLSFYVSVQSPLMWANQQCFVMNPDYSLPRVSGVAYTKNVIFGRQIWGHPLYNWEDKAAKPKVLDLWKLRLAYAAKLFDHLRFDHANGFYSYGSIDPENEKNDEMKKGPGEEVFTELINYSRSIDLDVFAEDLALHLIDLRSTMQKLDVAGIRMLRFAYDDAKNIFNDEYLHTDKYPLNSIAYTTSHDTEPLMGFLAKLTGEQKRVFADKYNAAFTDDKDLAVSLRTAVIESPSRIAIIPIQDWLLTTDRINIPGTEDIYHDKNWRYKVQIPVEELPDVL